MAFKFTYKLSMTITLVTFSPLDLGVECSSLVKLDGFYITKIQNASKIFSMVFPIFKVDKVNILLVVNANNNNLIDTLLI